MKFLTLSSIWLWVVRTVTVITIAVAYVMADKQDVMEQYCMAQDLHSNENEAQTSLSTISEAMCIYSGDGFDFHFGWMSAPTLFMFVAVDVLEGLVLIPLIQLPNLRWASFFERMVTYKSELQRMTDKTLIKDELIKIRRLAKVMHGGNLTAVGWVVFWTFTGNVFYIFGIGGALPYAGGLALFMLSMFCRCRCVKRLVSEESITFL